MINRRLAVTGLSVFAAASLALTACESGTTAGTSSPSAPASASTSALAPGAALTAALADLKTTGYDFKVTQGDATEGATEGATAAGTIDPTAPSATETISGTQSGVKLEVDATLIAKQLWAKLDAGALNAQLGVPNTWMSLDITKLGTGNAPFDISGATDLLDIADIMTSVSGVQSTDPTTITGTVDLTAATGDNSPDVSADGAAAKTTPFTATLDAQGHLTDLKIDTMAFDKAAFLDIAFSNYGSPTAVTPPAGTVTPAPDSVYSFFNGTS